MGNLIMVHGVSGCFGTSLAPRKVPATRGLGIAPGATTSRTRADSLDVKRWILGKTKEGPTSDGSLSWIRHGPHTRRQCVMDRQDAVETGQIEDVSDVRLKSR